MQSVTGFIERRLKLKVNEAKSAVARPQARKFLGFSFTGGEEPKRRIAPKALHRCKQKIRELTRRTRGISVEQMTKELTAYLRGWKGYFGFCQTPSVLHRLEKWMRRRLRSMIWKQWKRGQVRFRNPTVEVGLCPHYVVTRVGDQDALQWFLERRFVVHPYAAHCTSRQKDQAQ